LAPAVKVRTLPGQSVLFLRLTSVPTSPQSGLPKVRCFLPAALLLLVLPVSLSAEGSGRPGPGGLLVTDTLPPDSVRLNAHARAAQRSFERLHRSRLHQVLDTRSGRCDERIGRICVHFDGETGWIPKAEDASITEGRETLLDTLSALGSMIPGDSWILGQRVRYLGDLGRWSEAAAIAEGCTGSAPWWCPAMRGYIHHRSGRIVEASLSFQEALGEMPPTLARRWNDPAPLLDFAAGQWVKDTPGLSEDEARARFWRLADPLFLTPGNERQTEHYARHFGAVLFSDAATTLDVPWGSGPEDLLLRYGFVAGWERTAPAAGSGGGGTIINHFHPESRGLLPSFEALEDPAGLSEGAWVATESGRSTSAPLLSPLLVDAVGQTAVMRRGGGLLVLAAFEVPEDTVLLLRRGNGSEPPVVGHSGLAWDPKIEGSSPDTLTGLFLVADTGVWAPRVVMGKGGTGILQLRAPPGRYLLSLEQWNPVGRWGARVRHGVIAEELPADLPALSELLILETGPALPNELSQAVPRMRSTTVFGAGETITLGWEVYGLGTRREILTFEVRLIGEEGSLVRRALKRIGLFRKAPELTLSWTEGGPESSGPLFRAVDLDFPALDPGRYVVRLEMNIPYRGRVVSNRPIIIR
jgi:hypothetical protein